MQELTHSPDALLDALQTILDNALDLDAGRYVRDAARTPPPPLTPYPLPLTPTPNPYPKPRPPTPDPYP